MIYRALAVLFLASPVFAQSSVVAERPGDAYPQPGPTPASCPPGFHREFDEASGRTGCVKNSNDEPKPSASRNGRAAELSAALGSGDQAAFAPALETFFDASQSRGIAPGAVTAGPWRERPSGLVKVGVTEDVGNKLRDRNDKKLEEATKQQKETEKAWKDYKDKKSVSPRPPTADEVSIGGKG